MERKFTPPTSFPAEYVTDHGVVAVLLATAPDGRFIGYVRGANCTACSWGGDGFFQDKENPGVLDLHDLPPKIATIKIGAYASVQGPVEHTYPNGQVRIRVGEQTYTGQPVSAAIRAGEGEA